MRIAAILLILASAACGTKRELTPFSPAAADSVTLAYLGSQGWLVESPFGDIMLGPFFSNPNGARIAALPLNPDEEVIDLVLGNYPVSDVRAVLVGHGHFDHLMDAEYVVRNHTPRATVYGSETVARILRGYDSMETRVQPVESQAQCADRPGEWIDVPDTSIRFLAVCSDHAPQLPGTNLWPGNQEEDRTSPPRFSWDYKQGQTLSYLIEVQNARGGVFRILYSDAAADSTVGLPSDFGGDVDALLITGPGYDRVEAYPETWIDAVKPRAFFVGHWENFLSPWSTDPGNMPGTNIGGLRKKLDQMDGVQWTMPKPGQIFRFAIR